jgi:hypothetical protein
MSRLTSVLLVSETLENGIRETETDEGVRTFELDEVDELLGGVDTGSTVGRGREDGGNIGLGVGVGRNRSVVEFDVLFRDLRGGRSGHGGWHKMRVPEDGEGGEEAVRE